MRSRSRKVFLIGHRDRSQAEQAVVLHNYNARSYRFNSFPNPIVISIDIDGEKSDIFTEAGALKQSVYIFTRDPCTHGLQIVLPEHFVLLYTTDVRSRGVQDHTLPVVVYH